MISSRFAIVLTVWAVASVVGAMRLAERLARQGASTLGEVLGAAAPYLVTLIVLVVVSIVSGARRGSLAAAPQSVRLAVVIALVTGLTPWLLVAYPAALGETRTDTATQELEKQEVRAFVESFLTAYGEGDLDAMEAMFVPEANVGVVRFRDGAWGASTLTFADHMVGARERRRTNPEAARFREPIHEIDITIEAGQLAFARADTTVYRGDEVSSRPIDYFTLIRVDGEWKFLSAAYIQRRDGEE